MSVDLAPLDHLPRTALADFLRYLSTGEDPNHLLADDVRAEMNFPHASFTLDGKAALDHSRAGASDRPWVLEVKAAEPTADGFLVVVAARTFQGARTMEANTISTLSLRDDQVVLLRHWCTGSL